MNLIVSILFEVNPSAFRIILYFIYTGRLECELNLIEDVKLLAKQCRLFSLIKQIDDRIKKIKSFGETSIFGSLLNVL